MYFIAQAELQALIRTIKLDMILCRNRVYRQICDNRVEQWSLRRKEAISAHS